MSAAVAAAAESAAAAEEEKRNLSALEAVLAEFFSSSTSNARKAEIEATLTSFGEQRDAWRACLGFLTRTNSHYVAMFALNTLEKVIRRRWVGITGQEHTEIRHALQEFLSEHHRAAPPYIKNKLVKLIVDIARTDWPHFFHDFYVNILDMIRSKGTEALGLTMLLIASEELATPREDVATQRREELTKLLGQEVPQTMAAITEVLEQVNQRRRSPGAGGASVTSTSSSSGEATTPPPSPLQSADLGDGDGVVASAGGGAGSKLAFTASPLQQDGSLLQFASRKLLSDGGTRPTAARSDSPLGPDAEEVAALALRCLAHMFTWMQLTSNVSSRLLSIVFQFATQHETHPEVATLAMGAINELISRTFVPADFESYLVQLFLNVFNLLQSVVSDTNTATGQSRLASMDDTFVDMLTDFLRYFVGSHLRRFDAAATGHNSQLPVIEFLVLMYKYTFLQTRPEGLFACLDVWSVFVDYVSTAVAASRDRAEGDRLLQRYREALLALVAELLKRIQLRTNGAQIEQLDDKTVDDDEETEWQRYLRSCVETIMKVADLLPTDVLRIVYGPFKETSQTYLNLEGIADPAAGKLAIADPTQLRELHLVLRDFAALLQLVGRVSSLFIGENFLERSQEGNELIKQLIVLATFGSKMRLYAYSVPTEIANDFVLVQAQTFAALKAWCHWLSQLHALSLKNASCEPQCRDLTSRIVMAVAPVLRDSAAGSPADLVHSASLFMATLTGTVRPPSIWKLKEFTDLYGLAGSLRLPSSEDKRLLVRALSNVLLLHWPGLSEQRWEERQKHLTKFLRDLTGDFRQIRESKAFLTNSEHQFQAKPVIKETLQIVGDLIENVLDEQTATKQLCYNCVKEYVEIALWLFPAYVNDTDLCESLFTFFHVVFDVLKAQMGAEAVERAVLTFIDLFGKEQMARAVVAESRAIEKFLGIMEFIVKEPGSTFRKFVPSTLTLCMEQIHPLVADKPSADIKAPLFSLLTAILLHNWRFFFKPSVVRSITNPDPAAKGEEVQHRAEFLAVMQAYGQTFMHPDIAVFRQNLEALEQINTKWKLYHKPVFTQELIVQFLTVLLQVLVHRSHDLLREEIAAATYNMASVDFDAFFEHFVPSFLEQVNGLDDAQRTALRRNFNTDKDLPSFTANTQHFINDIRYYQICNASLPASSVKF